MKKNIAIIVLAVCLLISIIFNIKNINKIKSLTTNNSEEEVQILSGIYQTTYYNNYSKQIIVTLRFEDNNIINISEYAASYDGDGTDYKYVQDGDKLSLYSSKDGEYYQLISNDGQDRIIVEETNSTECNKYLNDSGMQKSYKNLRCEKFEYKDKLITEIEILDNGTLLYKNKVLYKIN